MVAYGKGASVKKVHVIACSESTEGGREEDPLRAERYGTFSWGKSSASPGLGRANLLTEHSSHNYAGQCMEILSILNRNLEGGGGGDHPGQSQVEFRHERGKPNTALRKGGDGWWLGAVG